MTQTIIEKGTMQVQLTIEMPKLYVQRLENIPNMKGFISNTIQKALKSGNTSTMSFEDEEHTAFIDASMEEAVRNLPEETVEYSDNDLIEKF